jgi:hypothetical protein
MGEPAEGVLIASQLVECLSSEIARPLLREKRRGDQLGRNLAFHRLQNFERFRGISPLQGYVRANGPAEIANQLGRFGRGFHSLQLCRVLERALVLSQPGAQKPEKIKAQMRPERDR